jgi:hypothetical protein
MEGMENDPLIQPQPETPALSPTPTPTRRTNILLFSALGLALVLGLGLAGLKIFRKQIQPAELPTQAVNTPTIQVSPTAATEIDKTGWLDFSESKYGITFKYPTGGWVIVSAEGDDYMEYDVKNFGQNAFVLISVRTDEKLGKEVSIEEAIKEEEKQLRAKESYVVSDFKSSVVGNSGSYYATGEEQNLLLSQDRSVSFEEMKTAKYNFQDRCTFQIGRKTLCMHGFALPGSPSEKVISGIMDSVKMK